ncbi:MAG TPA: hypothetical protein VK688_05420, partial [Gemmatimonadales bacterium]|nr:hypothetical protein [Gemmatimonadales bacterium]
MKPLDRITLIVLGVLLAAAVGAYVSTARSDAAPASAVAGSPVAGLVDRGPLETAQRLSSLAETPDEIGLARDALRLGD